MTEAEFDQQVWRRFDTVTIDTGIETTIMNVCFATRSVRLYIKGAPPEWMSFERLASHKSRYGGNPDDVNIIEELHNKVLKHQDEIKKLREERRELKENSGRRRVDDLIRALNYMQQGFTERKHKMEMIENALNLIQETIDKIDKDDTSGTN